MNAYSSENCQASYDRVAEEYVCRIFDELQYKPLDRQLLDRFAASVRNVGPVCDMGCGPGHVARYLHERGVEVVGIDLSEVMVEQARRLNPGIDFRQGDMLARVRPINAGPASSLSIPLSISRAPKWRRCLPRCGGVLRPGGTLLLAFHIGDETVHLDEWWGRQVSIDFFFFRSDEMAGYLREAGFEIEKTIEREPYAGVEHQSHRATFSPDGRAFSESMKALVLNAMSVVSAAGWRVIRLDYSCGLNYEYARHHSRST